jgi:hypothetical protein
MSLTRLVGENIRKVFPFNGFACSRQGLLSRPDGFLRGVVGFSCSSESYGWISISGTDGLFDLVDLLDTLLLIVSSKAWESLLTLTTRCAMFCTATETLLTGEWPGDSDLAAFEKELWRETALLVVDPVPERPEVLLKVL